MLDRSTAPPIHTIKTLQLPRPEQLVLPNGMKLYVLNLGEAEIVKLDAVFFAGRPQEEKQLAAKATAQLVREGSAQYKSAEISELMDFYGATFAVPHHLDSSVFSLFSLSKYMDKVLPIFADCLQNPTFEQSELQTFKDTGMQKLLVDTQKSDVIAYRALTEHIFGKTHPYGYNSTMETYAALIPEDLRQFHENWYHPANGFLFLTGKLTDDIIQAVVSQFGHWERTGHLGGTPIQVVDSQPFKETILRPNVTQTALKLGRRLFDKDHDDYHGMLVLNMVLGGYFGSRLMTNIRERNGFTYNIYSTLDTNRHDGCFYIATEVNSGYGDQVLQEIQREIGRLQKRSISKPEMEMVRNYLMGTLLTACDGPMAMASVIKGYLAEDYPLERFDELIETIQTITPRDLRDLARKWFDLEQFFLVEVKAK